MGIPKGTKLTGSPKDRTLKIRFDASTDQKIDELSKAKKKSKAQIIRDGIEIQYAELEK